MGEVMWIESNFLNVRNIVNKKRRPSDLRKNKKNKLKTMFASGQSFSYSVQTPGLPSLPMSTESTLKRVFTRTFLSL